MNIWSRISIQHLLYFCILVLIIPALWSGLAGFFVAKAQDDNLLQVRESVDGTSQSINQEISAPFYLSPNTIDPCNPKSIEKVAYPENWEIKYEYFGKNEITCKWFYYKDNTIIAVDYWKRYDRKLARREYYQNEKLISKEYFYVMDDSGSLECIKQRTYEGYDISECYSESGFLISVDPSNPLFSPIPRMLYWFSYR